MPRPVLRPSTLAAIIEGMKDTGQRDRTPDRKQITTKEFLK